jgi:hypothetical protein
MKATIAGSMTFIEEKQSSKEIKNEIKMVTETPLL